MQQSDTAAQVRRLSTPVRTLVHAAFVLTGVVTTLLGPILPGLSSRWALGDSQAGLLFTAQFLGSVLGVTSSSIVLSRRGFQFSLTLGLGLMAAGLSMLAVGTWKLGLVGIFCSGIGLGITIPTANLFVAGANPHRRAAALNILNLAWGTGALAWPWVAGLLQQHSRVQTSFLGLAVALGFLCVCVGRVRLLDLPNSPEHADDRMQPRFNPWRAPWLPALGLLFFLYVGTENAFSGWVASYARRLDSSSGILWVLTPSFFWAALLLGRAWAPAFLRVVPEAKLMRMGLVFAAIGITAVLWAARLGGVVAGVCLAGFGLASVFPIAVALLAERFGTTASRVAGVLFALGALGGATLPWLVGILSSRFGGLQAGLLVPLLATIGMLALVVGGLRPQLTAPCLQGEVERG